jgi:hypothetical protein
MAEERSNRLMTGMFRDRETAERAYGSLTARGYGKDDVSLLMSEDTRARCFPGGAVEKTELGTKAAEGAGVGGVAGGTVGALLLGLAAAGVAVPGLPIIAMGPLAAALVGAGSGGTVGAIIGALVGSGIPEERARLYDEGIKSGGIVVGVTPKTEEDAEYLEHEWTGARGEQIYRPNAEPARRIR